MRRKIVIGALGVAAAVFVPTGLSAEGSLQALDCPVGELAAVCGVVNTAYSTVCYQPTPDLPTLAFISIDLEGGAPVVCPEL